MNNELIRRKGLLLIISSPSGAGKTTLTRKLISDLSDTVLSVSVTTRQKRSNEEDGLHYYFIDDKSFDKMMKIPSASQVVLSERFQYQIMGAFGAPPGLI